MKRIFIAHILPRKDVLQNHLSVAGCNFCWNLIEGGVFDKVYSVLPPFINGNKNFDYPDLVYSDWRYSNGLKKKLAAIKEQLDIFKQIPQEASVWFYNITLINCFLFILLRLLRPKVKSNVIILDYTPYQRKYSLSYWMLWLCNHANGTITLANSPLFNVANTFLLPGVVPENTDTHPKVEIITKEFLISGVLREEISLISMLLKVFSKMPECKLHISGFCEDDSIIKEYSSKYNNIIYHGKVEYKEYVRLLETIPFLLSTRDPKAPENQCNFSSKIIEALLYNRIIVSTIHYAQLDGIKYFEVSSDVAQFAVDINQILAMSSDNILDFANQSSKVKAKYGVDIWKKAMEVIEQK